MKALVIYESMFGNTRTIASAIAESLATHAEVTLLPVSEAPARLDGDVDLVVIGGPTHAFGMSRPGTRRSAVEQGAQGVEAEDPGLREWLGGLTRTSTGQAIATFDTRLVKPRWLPGSAGRSAERQLRRRGMRTVALPESFFVTGVAGPLVDGEVDRAREWAATLTARLIASRQR